MPKVKLPRKSTIVDMTAMCDVAFLLLSFFILATKQKPPEVLTVKTPNSVSTKAAPDKSIIFTLTADGRVFLSLGDDTKKGEVLENINTTRGLGLTPAEIDKWKKQEFIGLPLGKIKSYLGMTDVIPPSKLEGIPIKDSASNELVYWIKSIKNANASMELAKLQNMLLVKGDNDASYPLFKNIKFAFKQNEIFKFRIVTNGEDAPVGSELYLKQKADKS